MEVEETNSLVWTGWIRSLSPLPFLIIIYWISTNKKWLLQILTGVFLFLFDISNQTKTLTSIKPTRHKRERQRFVSDQMRMPPWQETIRLHIVLRISTRYYIVTRLPTCWSQYAISSFDTIWLRWIQLLYLLVIQPRSIDDRVAPTWRCRELVVSKKGRKKRLRMKTCFIVSNLFFLQSSIFCDDIL